LRAAGSARALLSGHAARASEYRDLPMFNVEFDAPFFLQVASVHGGGVDGQGDNCYRQGIHAQARSLFPIWLILVLSQRTGKVLKFPLNSSQFLLTLVTS
jgi:hypothetical protein